MATPSRTARNMVSSPQTVPAISARLGLVDRRGDEMGRARRGPDHDAAAPAASIETHPFAQDPLQPAGAQSRRRAGRARRSDSTPPRFTLTAPSCSRSRETVAWVTAKPSAASRSVSSSWLREAARADQLGERCAVVASRVSVIARPPARRARRGRCACGSRPGARPRSAGRRSPRRRPPRRGGRGGSGGTRRRRPCAISASST